MAKGFSIQHLATVPAGWHVRTVKAGAHRVRVAFPPGRRKKGSGIPVEVLHPRHENPHCFKNPAELLLMGANPLTRQEAQRATRDRATRIRAARLSNSSPYDRLSVSEKLAFGRLGLGKAQLRTASDIRRARAEVAHVSRFRNRLPNPGAASVDSREAAQARTLSEAFHHREWREYEVRNEPHTPAGEYARLGIFIGLAVKPTEKSNDSIRQVREIVFPNGEMVDVVDERGQSFRMEGSDVIVISARSGHPLYLAGPQYLSEEDLLLFGGGSEDPCLIGEARAISYIDEKWHPEAGLARGKNAPYEHHFGDAGGTKPKVFYSRRMKRLLFEGGSYRVEAPGIVN